MAHRWWKVSADTDGAARSTFRTVKCYILQLQTRLQYKEVHMPQICPIPYSAVYAAYVMVQAVPISSCQI